MNLYKKLFLKKYINYYIASLECNLILKEELTKYKQKEIEELSQKSRLLQEKGAAYQNDIGWTTSKIAPYYNFLGFGVTYSFITYPNVINETCYKYKFYDTVDKKLKIVKFILHFCILKEMDLNFKD